MRTVAKTDGACRALASRDTDLVFQTVFVARSGAGSTSLESLRGRRLVLGSRDSAQAAILPVHFLHEAGLSEADVNLTRIDSDVGKHGDTGRSELGALRAVLDDRADAAAIGINTRQAIGRGDPWVANLLGMDWENPQHRPILEMEGLRAWVPPKLEGYASLVAAVSEQGITARW